MTLPLLPWPEGLKDTIQLVSFDIFDTLIFRKSGTPDDFFFHLAHEAKNKGLWPQDDNQSFVKLRRKAEDSARRARFAKSGHREVTLAEIYSNWPSIAGEELCVLEAELELAGWIINPVAICWLEEAFTEGKKVALVSDMYLDSDLIVSFIKTQLPSLVLDLVLVSGESGCSKQDGGLFATLINRCGVRATNILHIGDNAITDGQMALAAGIHNLVVKPPEYFLLLTNYEHRLGTTPYDVDALRRRWLWHYPDESFAANISALVYGPFLFHLIHWLQIRCKALGIDTLFCLLREGEVISSLLASMNCPGLDVKTVYISRRSSLLPALLEVTPEVLHQLSQRRGYTLFECTEDLGLQLPDHWQSMATTCLSALVGTQLWDELLTTVADKKDVIREYLQSQRQLLLSYLLDIGLENRSGIALWDWGCGASMFTNLARLMPLEQSRFFMTYASAKSEAFSLLHHLEVFLPIDERAIALSKAPELSEILLNGSLCSTRAYHAEGGVIYPELVPSHTMTMSHSALINDFRRAVHSFVALAIKSGIVPLIDFSSRKAIASILYRLIRYPLSSEAICLGQLQVPLSSGVTTTLICEDVVKAFKQHYSRADEASADVNLGRLASSLRGFWNEGAIAQAFPGSTGLLGELGMSAGDDIVAPLLLANLQHSHITHTAVYGAGELGAQVLQLLREQGITVSIVIDRRAAAGCFELDGLPVVTLAEAFSRGERVFAVASKVFANEIISEIQHTYSMYEPVVISYLGSSPMKMEA
ncbi:hypothetical protein E0Z06_10350 [Rheinheimera sp. D18]|uniref:HAD-IA family hydrolase n=1 Tax=Rheinheimera sp. D18 TaxID=2545632 RepID=UPI00104BE648|nr:HAD-IA family hydrolase [Rheinheimera sp. D18]QBL09896.1 hypothetical protein E0Z06_10350 [Rheinheimera sp. D18]